MTWHVEQANDPSQAPTKKVVYDWLDLRNRILFTRLLENTTYTQDQCHIAEPNPTWYHLPWP